MSENKTAEEILKRNVQDIAKCNVTYNITNQGILNAMKEYANQQNQELQSQVEELKQENEILFKANCNNLKDYTQIKEAADEMANCIEKTNGIDYSPSRLIALDNYKQLKK